MNLLIISKFTKIVIVKTVKQIDHTLFTYDSLSQMLSNIIKHQNIVKYYSYKNCGKSIYSIQQYFPYGNLATIMSMHKRISQEYTKYIIKQVVSAILYLNQHHIAHFMINPRSIFITDDFKIKLSDFRAAEIYGNKFIKKRQGDIYYMPPQQLNLQFIYQTCDIWAIGVLAYYLLYGQLPYNIKGYSQTHYDLLANHIQNTQLSFHKEFDQTSQECKQFIKSCLIKQKDKRPTAKKLINHQWFEGDTQANIYPLLCLGHNPKQISMHFLLHFNEDFDDDLLLDAIDLLHEIK